MVSTLLQRFAKIALILALATGLAPAYAQQHEQGGLTLTKVRAVGDYRGTTYDDVVELWFAAPLVFPNGSLCQVTSRVFVNASKMHLVAAAYLAISKGRKVLIHTDEALPIRDGACEVSYLDVGTV